MRDYFVVAIVLGSLPVALALPFYGLLVYAWLSYMYPHMHAWGFAQTLPLAKMTALATAIGTVVNGGIRIAPLLKRETLLMVLLWGTFTISGFFAFNPVEAWNKWQDVSKVIIMALLTAMLLNSLQRIRYFLLVVGLSLGFYGFKGGLFSIFTGGQFMVWGPEASVIDGNNNIGLALNMTLPILWYLSQEEKGWLKRLLQATFFLTIPAVLFTYSRASALTVPIVLLLLMFRGRNRLFLATAILIGSIVSIPFIPERWWNRQETTFEYEEDRSAMSRIENWKLCWRVAMDRPLTGGGFKFFSRDVFARYYPEFLSQFNRTWDTHNIYFAILTSHGFPALFVWSGMIFFCFFSCWQMQRVAGEVPELRQVGVYCNMIRVSMVAFMVNGTFVNMEYFDLPFHWVAVVASMRILCERARESAVPEVEMPEEVLAS